MKNLTLRVRPCSVATLNLLVGSGRWVFVQVRHLWALARTLEK
jgi:hypothetical protein